MTLCLNPGCENTVTAFGPSVCDDCAARQAQQSADSYVVTLTCGCSWQTTRPPAIGDLLPCPQREVYRVIWVRKFTGEDDWEDGAA